MYPRHACPFSWPAKEAILPASSPPSAPYGCRSASSDVRRLLGLNTRSRLERREGGWAREGGGREGGGGGGGEQQGSALRNEKAHAHARACRTSNNGHVPQTHRSLASRYQQSPALLSCDARAGKTTATRARNPRAKTGFMQLHRLCHLTITDIYQYMRYIY